MKAKRPESGNLKRRSSKQQVNFGTLKAECRRLNRQSKQTNNKKSALATDQQRGQQTHVPEPLIRSEVQWRIVHRLTQSAVNAGAVNADCAIEFSLRRLQTRKQLIIRKVGVAIQGFRTEPTTVGSNGPKESSLRLRLGDLPRSPGRQTQTTC